MMQPFLTPILIEKSVSEGTIDSHSTLWLAVQVFEKSDVFIWKAKKGLQCHNLVRHTGINVTRYHKMSIK